MDMRRVELKRTPPKEPLTSLAALVRDFKWRFPRERRDTAVTLCEAAPDIKTAIQIACDSIKADGKHHNHQVKVRKSARDEFAVELGKVFSYYGPDWDDFHEVWEIADEVKPWGIGPLTVYDVAVRVAAHPYIDLTPTRLYLHTGARQGLLALIRAAGLYDEEWRRDLRGDWLLPSQLPARFGRHLTMDETEDFLCTYRNMYDELTDFKL